MTRPAFDPHEPLPLPECSSFPSVWKVLPRQPPCPDISEADFELCSPLGLSLLSPSLSGPHFSGGTSPSLLALNAVSMLRPQRHPSGPGLSLEFWTCHHVPPWCPLWVARWSPAAHPFLACAPDLSTKSVLSVFLLSVNSSNGPGNGEKRCEFLSSPPSLPPPRTSCPRPPAAPSLPALSGLPASGLAPRHPPFPCRSLSSTGPGKQPKGSPYKSDPVSDPSSGQSSPLAPQSTSHCPGVLVVTAEGPLTLPSAPRAHPPRPCWPAPCALAALPHCRLMPAPILFPWPRVLFPRGRSLTSVRSPLMRHLPTPPPAVRTSVATPPNTADSLLCSVLLLTTLIVSILCVS